MKKLLQMLLLCLGVAAGHRATGQFISPAAKAERSSDELKEIYCGTPDITEEYLDAHPEIREWRAAIEAQTKQYIEDNDALDQKATGPQGPLITIPVVVHVIFNTRDQDLDDAVIRAQIDELNLAFRDTLMPGPRARITHIPRTFALRAGDARVQFCLATRDPDGRPTNGITRRDNTGDTRYIPLRSDSVKYTAGGGTDAWNTAHYLNIWCHDTGSSSIAVFPGTAAKPREDGVVMWYGSFGRGHRALDTRYTLGRVAVHEIGHWLNLRHIWGDATVSGNGLCLDSDDVSDTPNQSIGNIGNPSFPGFPAPPVVRCPNEPDGDMFMNHMDYVDDDSKLLFTRRQVLRMQASFAPATPTRRGGYRESLRSSPGLCPTLSITSQSGTLPPNVNTGDTTDYGFRVNPISVGCAGGTILYQ